jgi:hypothetical protein
LLLLLLLLQFFFFFFFSSFVTANNNLRRRRGTKMGVVVNKIHPEYVSGGCNHSAHALDADYSQNVIVYASNKNVFELHISSGGVATILGDGVGAGGSDAK